MRTTFLGIEVARRALQAQQRSLEVAGHNIANANTPGYSRQQAVHRTTRPLGATGLIPPVGAGQIGTGVTVGEITRMRDAFVDMQLRNALQAEGEWKARYDTLNQLELLLLEPSDVGLRNDFDLFWQALQNLHVRPEVEAERAVVRERAIALTETFHHLYQGLEDLRLDLDRHLVLGVAEVNSIIEELGELNQLIRQVDNTGMNPNDLLDRRDLLLGQLSELVRIGVVEDPSGTVRVSISGVTVVDEWGDVRRFVTERDPARDVSVVKLEGSAREVAFRGGRLAGVTAMRDGQVPSLQKALDDMAKALIQSFNDIHREGYDLNGDEGGDFFVGDGARTIAVADGILDPELGLNRIAAAGAPDAPGDGSNALHLARLSTEKILGGGRATIGEFWAGVVGGLGVDAQKARHMVQSQEVVVGHLNRQREAVSGVNLDEEMAGMIRYQHAYQAAARLMTAIDDMLETIILRMGLVGR